MVKPASLVFLLIWLFGPITLIFHIPYTMSWLFAGHHTCTLRHAKIQGNTTNGIHVCVWCNPCFFFLNQQKSRLVTQVSFHCDSRMPFDVHRTPPCNHYQWFNTLRPRQYGYHFADDIFKRIFLSNNDIISLEISLKFVIKVQINKSSLGSDNGLVPTR